MGLFSSIASAAGSLIGGYADRQETRHNNKQQYVYNSWLQGQNQSFQKYMAQNAHQLEMQDLQKAGLNPALTAMSSTASSIAGSSSPQGTSAGSTAKNFSNSAAQIVDSINSLRRTNADITNTTKTADANMKNAEAAYMNAVTQRKLAEEGGPGKLFGTEGKNTASALALTALGLLPFGIGGAFKGIKLANNAIKGWKAGKQFGNFLNALK